VAVEKLSISLDAELAAGVRAAAGERGVSVSTWLAEAAQAQVRQLRLREALDAVAAEDGPLSPEETDALIAAARRTSQVVFGAEGAA
jgi:Ribbon-helix-helix protein, copG family.